MYLGVKFFFGVSGWFRSLEMSGSWGLGLRTRFSSLDFKVKVPVFMLRCLNISLVCKGGV